ncbi:MAG: hypothetical protein ABIJ31_03675, partial [Pseudomonadota bacterium]
MFRICLGSVAWFGFGVIFVEMVNNFDLIGFRFNAYLLSGAMVLVFLLSEAVLGYYKKKSNQSVADEEKYKKMIKHYYFLLGFIGFIVFFCIPF